MQVTSITTADGAQLAVRVYEDSAKPAQSSLVIGGAMGVRQDYYAAFAQWLAAQGWRVTTFDYRGSGDSLPNTAHGGLRGFKADLYDWTRDYETVVHQAHAALPQAPLYLMGHSLGAQLPGLMRDTSKISGLLSVAAGSGYWRENAPQLKRIVPYFWFLLVPLATKLCGYFPGRRLKKVGDLPKGVILQWRRWCLNPRYSVGVEGESARQSYANVQFPVLALSITDDELMTLRGTHSLVNLYANAPREVLSIAPADVAARRLGHFGPFRPEQASQLWPRLNQWLGGLSARTATA
ncbi:alpha/beta fold hydrolase, partial [Rhodoferax saidenbachensis]|uniref:Alpha/beta hydrolase n=1 Tax=Rhodoferax saidenbachensis TaxID=1484693 RepID=A0A1P8KDN9_9BURK